MDYFDNHFGYDSYNPPGSYNLQPEDLNPALRNNYIGAVNSYYSEPPVSRFRNHKKINKQTLTSKQKFHAENSTLYMLIIVLIIITVIQWVIIFCSSNTPIIINHNMTSPPTVVEPTKVEKTE
jgi:hypothetical protein